MTFFLFQSWTRPVQYQQPQGKWSAMEKVADWKLARARQREGPEPCSLTISGRLSEDTSTLTRGPSPLSL